MVAANVALDCVKLESVRDAFDSFGDSLGRLQVAMVAATELTPPCLGRLDGVGVRDLHERGDVVPILLRLDDGPDLIPGRVAGVEHRGRVAIGQGRKAEAGQRISTKHFIGEPELAADLPAREAVRENACFRDGRGRPEIALVRSFNCSDRPSVPAPHRFHWRFLRLSHFETCQNETPEKVNVFACFRL